MAARRKQYDNIPEIQKQLTYASDLQLEQKYSLLTFSQEPIRMNEQNRRDIITISREIPPFDSSITVYRGLTLTDNNLSLLQTEVDRFISTSIN